jgi:hypothetical protein
LRTDELASDVALYIEANPLRRGWVQKPEDWPWSSAHPDFARQLDRERVAPAMTGADAPSVGRRESGG